ncbi:hypothetical protein BX616_002843 [Lobosporangium transversale]|nr:hypothetical protein BX616_002843 [Lobosporangium transversale]
MDPSNNYCWHMQYLIRAGEQQGPSLLENFTNKLELESFDLFLWDAARWKMQDFILRGSFRLVFDMFEGKIGSGMSGMLSRKQAFK